jgi:hypothetical protein
VGVIQVIPAEFLWGYTVAAERKLSRAETRTAIEDCQDFFMANEERLREAVYDHYTWRDAGSDFWHSRRGDDGYLTRDELEITLGAKLHTAALSYGAPGDE